MDYYQTVSCVKRPQLGLLQLGFTKTDNSLVSKNGCFLPVDRYVQTLKHFDFMTFVDKSWQHCRRKINPLIVTINRHF